MQARSCLRLSARDTRLLPHPSLNSNGSFKTTQPHTVLFPGIESNASKLKTVTHNPNAPLRRWQRVVTSLPLLSRDQQGTQMPQQQGKWGTVTVWREGWSPPRLSPRRARGQAGGGANGSMDHAQATVPPGAAVPVLCLLGLAFLLPGASPWAFLGAEPLGDNVLGAHRRTPVSLRPGEPLGEARPKSQLCGVHTTTLDMGKLRTSQPRPSRRASRLHPLSPSRTQLRDPPGEGRQPPGATWPFTALGYQDANDSWWGVAERAVGTCFCTHSPHVYRDRLLFLHRLHFCTAEPAPARPSGDLAPNPVCVQTATSGGI